jgi:hypothetical protein
MIATHLLVKIFLFLYDIFVLWGNQASIRTQLQNQIVEECMFNSFHEMQM